MNRFLRNICSSVAILSILILTFRHQYLTTKFVDPFDAARLQRLQRLRFLRRCAEERVRLLPLSEDVLRRIETTPRLSASIVDKVVRFVVFSDRVVALQSIVDDLTSSGRRKLDGRAASGHGRANSGNGLTGLVNRTTSTDESVHRGFVLFEGTPNPLDISVLHQRRNDDPEDDGYFWIPSSSRGVAMAFPPFETRPVNVEGLDGVFHAPVNVSRFLWELEAAEFVACDEKRNEAFSKKSVESVKLNETKDEMRIKGMMRMIVGLRKTMANWHKRNWIFSGTLLGWYRQCSIIPYDYDTDTAQRIDDYEDWMIQFFRVHPLLKLRAKFGLKDDSLEFQMGKWGSHRVDLFWIYSKGNGSWMGLQAFDDSHSKLVYLYPKIGRICSADLHRYLVYVPCDSWSIVRANYGADDWFTVKRNHDYTKDIHNLLVNGTWTKKQWEGGEVFTNYQ